MRRRTLLSGGLAVVSIGVIGVPALVAVPTPRLFEHDCLTGCINLHTRQPIADMLRADFLRQVDFVSARRTAATQRRMLRAMYTFEMTYDGVPPALFYDELSEILISEIAAELAAIQPVHLVALDTPGVKIDPATFEPYLGFYIDHNA